MHPVRIHTLESGREPTDLVPGEIAINNYDGIIFIKDNSGNTIKLRERNHLYDVSTLQERNDLAINNVMRNGDYVRYIDRGFKYMEVYFDYKWYTMYRLAV